MSFAKDPRVDAYTDALPAATDHVNVFLYDANNRAGGWRKLEQK